MELLELHLFGMDSEISLYTERHILQWCQEGRCAGVGWGVRWGFGEYM